MWQNPYYMVNEFGNTEQNPRGLSYPLLFCHVLLISFVSLELL